MKQFMSGDRGYRCWCGSSFKFRMARDIHNLACKKIKGEKYTRQSGFEIIVRRLKCLVGKHEDSPNYGVWAKGWGTKYVCWWCGREYKSFERDKDVDPIPGPLPSCHPDSKKL